MSVLYALSFFSVYSKQRLNIKISEIEIGLDRGFAKHRLNFVQITSSKNLN